MLFSSFSMLPGRSLRYWQWSGCRVKSSGSLSYGRSFRHISSVCCSRKQNWDMLIISRESVSFKAHPELRPTATGCKSSGVDLKVSPRQSHIQFKSKTKPKKKKNHRHIKCHFLYVKRLAHSSARLKSNRCSLPQFLY